MGRLWSYNPECQGHTINGIVLGEPVDFDGDPATMEWDDSALPNGMCDIVDGALVVWPDETNPNVETASDDQPIL